MTHMDGQMHTIEKAIRPLFADPVTYYSKVFMNPLYNSKTNLVEML